MSAKVYHGMILRGATLEGALSICKELRNICLKYATDAVTRKRKEALALIADLQVNNLEIPEDEPKDRRSIYNQIKAAKKKVLVDGIRDVDWDYTFELALIPWKGDILALHFMENDPGYQEAMTKLGFEQ